MSAAPAQQTAENVAGTPDKPAAQTGNPAAPPLSTASLTASLLAELSGEPPATPPAPVAPEDNAAGPESPPAASDIPAPEAGEDSERSDPETPPTKDVDGLHHAVTALRAERRELKARLKELEQKVAASAAPAPPKPEAEPEAAAPVPPPPVTPGLAKLEKDQQQHEAIHQWSRRMLKLAQRGETDKVQAELAAQKVALPDTSDEAVVDWLETVRDNAAQKLSGITAQLAVEQEKARYQALSAQAADEQRARELFPWFSDTASRQYQLAQQIARETPWVVKLPSALVTLGHQVEGLLAVEARRRPAASKPKLPPAPPAATAMPAASPAGSNGAQAARDRFFQNPTPENKKAWMDATLAA